MPFTPAHSAIVLPFIRMNPHVISATGLIIGSVTPDFEYFFKMSVSGRHSHSIAGLFYFDIPIAVLLALVFHGIVKKKMISNLPSFLQQRLQPLLRLDFVAYLKKNVPTFLLSALAGAASHIFWDAFTHGDGFFVERLSIYQDAFIPFQGVEYPLWYALQHISTAVGLFLIAVYIIFMPADESCVLSQPLLTYWFFVICVAVTISATRFLIYSDDYNLGNLVVTLITGSCVGLVLGGLLPLKNQHS